MHSAWVIKYYTTQAQVAVGCEVGVGINTEDHDMLQTRNQRGHRLQDFLKIASVARSVRSTGVPCGQSYASPTISLAPPGRTRSPYKGNVMFNFLFKFSCDPKPKAVLFARDFLFVCRLSLFPWNILRPANGASIRLELAQVHF